LVGAVAAPGQARAVGRVALFKAREKRGGEFGRIFASRTALSAGARGRTPAVKRQGAAVGVFIYGRGVRAVHEMVMFSMSTKLEV